MAPTFKREQDLKCALADVEVIQVVAQRSSVTSIGDKGLLERLESRFEDSVRASDRLSALVHSFETQSARYCVFGGWVRDTISHVKTMPVVGSPRDIDLVVQGVEIETLLSSLPGDVRPTIFGGIQSEAAPIAFDVWPLHETFLIDRLGLAPTFESLLQTTDFTINAALFFPRQAANEPTILDGGMFEALDTRTLAFNCEFLAFPVMQCARLAAYAGKLSLDLAPTVRAFMRGIVQDPARYEQVLFGLDKFYPASISSRAQGMLHKLIEDTR
jgi:hypothetical protein